MKILFIGPRFNKELPSKTGGTIVLFENLLEKCDELNINYEVIDSKKGNYKNKLLAIISIILGSLIKIPKVSHVSIHGSGKDYTYIAPFIIFFSKIFKKTISLRKFAGDFDILYDNCSTSRKQILKYVLKNSDINFFETKYLVKQFKLINENTYWFPNVRKKTNIKREGNYKKRFIFLSQIKEEKGIREIFEVSNQLDNSYTFDIYGNLLDNMKNTNFNNYNVNYKGALNPEDVQKTLSQYDVFILPTFWKSEGYPGVIIEALSVGLPIISTNLRGIKEMVDSDSSILIEPKNILQLKKAIESINDKNYLGKSTAALKQFSNFDSQKQTEAFLKKIGVLI